jgi:hypothetical protein
MLLKTKNVPFIKSLNLNKLSVKPGFVIKQKILNVNEEEKSTSNSFRDPELLKSSSHSSLFNKPSLTSRIPNKQNEVFLKMASLNVLDKKSKMNTRIISEPNQKFSDLIKMYKTNYQLKASAPLTSPSPLPLDLKIKSKNELFNKSNLESNETCGKSCQV